MKDMADAIRESQLRRDVSSLDAKARQVYLRGKASNPELFEYFESLDENPALILAEQGHAIEKQLGQNKGDNRMVLKTWYDDGLINQERVVKVPKVEARADSVNTQRQRSSWKTNQRETRISNLVGNHPNICKTLDVVRTPLGVIYTVEEFHPGVIDLETRVQEAKLLPKEFESFASDIIDTTYHLNFELGVLHKDLKPGNVLVPKNNTTTSRYGRVLIADLDNAGQIMHSDPSLLPTRGSSQYTHPKLLGAPIKQQPANATLQTEAYSVGATLFYALTGSAPFDYALRKDEEGIEVEVAGKVERVALFDGTERINAVDPRAHNKKLKQQLKRVPRKYRKVLYRSMTLSEDAYESISELREDFNQTTGGNRLLTSLKKASMPLALALALTKICYDNVDPKKWLDVKGQRTQPSSNTRVDLTREEFMRIENLTYHPIRWDAQLNEKNLRYYILFEAYKDLDEHLPGLLQKVAFSNHAVDRRHDVELVRIANDLAENKSWEKQPGLDVNIGIAWLAGSYLSDADKMREEFGGLRDEGPGYAPKTMRYLAHPADHAISGYEVTSSTQNLIRGKRHLVNLLQANHGDVEQAFIQFYFEREAINRAQQESASQEFLPIIRVDGSVEPGYVSALRQRYPERTRTLLNSLVALNATSIEYDVQSETEFVKYQRVRSAWANREVLEGNIFEIETMLGRRKQK